MTVQYGLLGKSLSHSFSRTFFADKFAREGIDARYDNFECPRVTDILPVIAANPQLVGFNVTIPYKRDIIPLLDKVDAAAAEIGAVNTVKVSRNNGRVQLIGYNTDVIGFGRMLDSFALPPGTHVLMLGTGGASDAVRYACRIRNLAVTAVSRSSKGDISYADITDEIIAAHRVIVNATPLGTFPDMEASPDIPYELITPAHIAIDLVYNPPVTQFLRKCMTQGAAARNGLQMLYSQALAAYDIWTK